MRASVTGRWLLLFHQIPPKPEYVRVKVWRRLQRLGAVPVQNAVWVLPYSEQALEDFRWLLQEIVAGGGEGSLCRGEFVDGLRVRDIEALFRHRRLRRPVRRPRSPARRGVHGRTWVTRRGVFVDRIASAWLIARFIDPTARFKFVAPDGYEPRRRELRFDMFEAEYTHEGNRCTFETLLARFRLRDPGLRAIAEMVHDIDCKDGKFGRAGTAGVARRLAALARATPSDRARLTRGADVLDALYDTLASPARRNPR